MLPGTSVLISEQYPRHYRRPCRRCIVGIWEPSETGESNKLSNQRQNLLFYPRRNIQGIQWAFYHSDNIIDNTINTEPDLTSLVDFVNRKKAGNSADFSIPTISEREVLEIIKSLPSIERDGISSPLLKLIAPAVSPSLAKVINCSIINSICPAQLKLARVTPIYKQGSKTDLDNYRPISVLPVISKILEKHVCKHFIAFLANHHLLYKCQSGFRANHSCETILIKITDEWLEAMDKGLFTGVVMIDLRKAFDVVDHKLLLKKLQVYG